jgi:hypothetical protein
VAVGAVVAVSACAIAFAAVIHPTLISPKGKVGPGHIKLVVKDPAAHGGIAVFVQIEPQKHLDKHGKLKPCTNASRGCDFVELKRVKNKPGYWSYVTPAYTFPGWWTTTPRKYYWQALHADCADFSFCADLSKVGTITVK